MLCLLLTACWHSVIAGEDELISRNHTTEYTITASSDPWSPVVGDTEGDVAVNFRATNLPGGNHGRPGESLVENLRKQLMKDNYDYMSNDSRETESPNVSVTRTVRTTERTVSITNTPSDATVYTFRATNLLPHITTKSVQIQMQVASVSIPLKGKKGKNIQPLDESPRFRAFDEVPQSHATKMTKKPKAEQQIVVSKKDLLFYIDDSHLTRRIAGKIYRRRYDNSDVNIMNSTNGNNRVINGKQKLDKRHNLYDGNSKRQQVTKYDINQNARRSRRMKKTTSNMDDINDQNDVKYAEDLSTKYNSGMDNQYDSNDVKYTENVPPKSHQSTQRQYSDQSDESQNVQNNDEENASAVYMNQPLKRRKKHKNTSQTSHQNDSKDAESDQFAKRRHMERNHKKLHRKNQLHKEKKRKHVTVSHPGNRQNTKLLKKNSTRGNRKQKMRMNKKMERLASDFEKFKKFRQQRIQQQKAQQNEVKQKKKVQPKRRQRRRKVIRKKHDKRMNKNSRKNNMLGDLHEKEYEHEDQNKAKDGLENQIDEANDERSDTTVRTGDPSDIKDDHEQNSQNENDKNVDDKHDDIKHDELKEINHKYDLNDNPHDDKPRDDTPHDDTPHDDTPHDDKPQDDTPDDELKDEDNIDQKDQDDKKIVEFDSIDNEELEGFNGRRTMNDDINSTQVNKLYNQCNDSHQCGNQVDEIQNPQDDNQLKANTTQSVKKYKLLEVPVAGGSRRNNKGSRQIIQERDANGVALYTVDEGPFPQFRLPRDRRQYMDDHVDKRPPLLELSKKSPGGRHSSRRHNH